MTEEATEESKKVKTFPMSPPHRLPYEVGAMFVITHDVYPTPDHDVLVPELDDWHGFGGEANFFPKGSTVMLVDQKQFLAKGKAYVRVKLLQGEQAGWFTVVESPIIKEWKWLIPLKQKKLINEKFAECFTNLHQIGDVPEEHLDTDNED